jgi:hypothetical protein
MSFGEYADVDDEQLQAIKRAVWLAHEAFTEILADPAIESFPEVHQTLDFFAANVNNVAERINQRQQ